MSTDGERSVLSLLRGGPAVGNHERERARPDLCNSPSGNYGPTAELADNLIALRDADQAALAESALRWERHLEPGVPGVAMRIEPNSSTYVPWIVLPVDGAYHVMMRTTAGQLAAERCHWWLRAWLTVAALAMATIKGRLIDDREDPPGEARPGPVYARADVDEKPWTGSPHPRRNRGILPSVLCGERSFQRSYPPKDPDADYRLTRGYMDQSQHSQIAQMALGIDWQRDPSESGDWPVLYEIGLRQRFGVSRIFACLADEERANILWAWKTKSVEAVERVLPYLDGWYYDRGFTLAAHDNGSLWMLCEAGGRTSTASTEAATFDAETRESGWLAANNGMRDASAESTDIVSTRGWEDGDYLRAERSDGRYGVRSLAKPSGRELWRLILTRDSNTLRVPGRPDQVAGKSQGASTTASGAAPVPCSPAVPASPAPGAGAPGAGLDIPMAEDGNPLAYHDLTGLLVGEITTLVSICVGRLTPPATRYAAGVLRELANRLEPPKRH